MGTGKGACSLLQVAGGRTSWAETVRSRWHVVGPSSWPQVAAAAVIAVAVAAVVAAGSMGYLLRYRARAPPK